MNELIHIVDGRTWKTPLTDRAPVTYGGARLVKKHYRGVYRYEGVGGFEYYWAKQWLPVVALQRRHGREWKTWMVDDPLHWDGMREAVEDLPSGRILVAGLGLGLFAHHMAADPRFDAIDVVELSYDVVELIDPTLPDDPRLRIHPGVDFYRYVETSPMRHLYDGVLWDLAVGSPDETRADFVRGKIMTDVHLGVPIVQFGLKRSARLHMTAKE